MKNQANDSNHFRRNNPQPLIIRYKKRSGWIVVGKNKCFEKKEDAENYCITKLHQCPKVMPEATTRTIWQDLPHRSVWTGAPWDRSFARI